MPLPSVAVPIPGKRKARSIPGSSGENSYIDQHKDADLLHRLEDMQVKDTEEEEEMDEKEVQSKFGIAWVASDDFDDDARHLRCISYRGWTDVKPPRSIHWRLYGVEVVMQYMYWEHLRSARRYD